MQEKDIPIISQEVKSDMYLVYIVGDHMTALQAKITCKKCMLSKAKR